MKERRKPVFNVLEKMSWIAGTTLFALSVVALSWGGHGGRGDSEQGTPPVQVVQVENGR